MTIERRRPLPAGRYWADVFPQNRIYFDEWIRMAQSRNAIHGEVSEHFDGVDGSPEHDFVIFSTNQPLVWPDADMGFAPNVAPPSITTSADTAQRPPPEPSPIEQLNTWKNDLGKVVGTALAVALAAVVVIGGVSLLGKVKRRR